MIIIVVGMPGSGKDVFVQAARLCGFSKIGMGDVVRHFASLAGLDSSDVSIGGFANSQRQEHGPAVWAERTLEMMPDGNVIIDGSRSLDEITFFKERLGNNLKVIAITASPEIRFKRLQDRCRQDGPLNRGDFDRREQRELSWGLEKAIESADISISNESSLADFKERCLAILENTK
jgi:dephospho-CoA kinase